MFSTLTVVFISLLLSTSWCDKELKFPPDFKFGAASAAYQVEGAWNVSDKGESVWDHLLHNNPSFVADGSNGDVACDSYHKYKEDVQMAVNLGLQFYRFSVAWPRLLPTGFPDVVSEAGSRYYSDLIDELLAAGIEPVLTIYHWEMPQKLHELGGWTNPHITDWFADYARVVFSLYADRVKTWVTINEPVVICDGEFITGPVAPKMTDPEYGNYLCNKNVLVAHAKAFRVFDEEFRAKYGGKLSIGNHAVWYEAATPADDDIAELARQYGIGRYSHPIYSEEGGWPPMIEKIIAQNSKKQGFKRSRLPAFTEEEIKLVRGTYDYYGFNHYTSRTVRRAEPGEEIIIGPLDGSKDLGAVFEKHPNWVQAPSRWLYLNPIGIRKQLSWFKKNYGDIEYFIAENGYPSLERGLEDDARIDFFSTYLEQILLAIIEDGVNVTGYTAWTLMDNFEWIDGYSVNFGLHEVDFTDPERPRTPRKSAVFYKNLIQTRSLSEDAVYNKIEL